MDAAETAAAAAAAAVAPVTAAAAAATGYSERERDAAAAAAAAAEMEERAEARFREAPAEEMEDPELLQGCKCAMMRNCPPCPFSTGKTCVLSWQGQSSPTVQGYVICKNCHLCGLCWEDCESKNSHVPTSPYVASTLTRLLKTDRGG